MQEVGLAYEERITTKDGENVLDAVMFTLPGIKFCRSAAFLGLLFVDACHLCDRARSRLLGLVTITADHKIIPLAAMISDNENKVSYESFFMFLRGKLPESFTLMSDQHAGMISAFDSVFANCPSVKRIPCFYHLTNKLKPSVIWELKQILTCDHREAYTAMIDCFRRERPALYEKYEKTIQAMSYMSNTFAGLFEVISDSPIESFNAAILPLRQGEPLELIEGLIEFAKGQLASQTKQLPKDAVYCQSCQNIIAYRMKKANGLTCRKALNKYVVTETFVGTITVDYDVQALNQRLTCSCRGYERLGIPCRHMYAVVLFDDSETARLPPISTIHRVKTIRDAVQEAQVDVNCKDLQDTEIGIRDPAPRPGRPPIKRVPTFREYLFSTSTRRCSACGETGHTKRAKRCKANQPKREESIPTFLEYVAREIAQKRSNSVEPRYRQNIICPETAEGPMS